VPPDVEPPEPDPEPPEPCEPPESEEPKYDRDPCEPPDPPLPLLHVAADEATAVRPSTGSHRSGLIVA